MNYQTISVMVPWDCNNNCPFCVSKAEYRNCKFNMELTKQNLNKYCYIKECSDVVFTGGEPLANLNNLNELIKVIPKDNRHKIFINTSLPPMELKDFTNLIVNIANWSKPGHWDYNTRLRGLNISHHIGNYTKIDENFDEKIQALSEITSVRLNCVLYDNPNLTEDDVLRYIEKYSDYNIQFRKDYTTVTLENLYDLANDKWFNFFNKLGKDQQSIEGSNFRWNYRPTDKISYHVTLPYSTVNGQVNDVVIHPDGSIRTDWEKHSPLLDLSDRVYVRNL